MRQIRNPRASSVAASAVQILAQRNPELIRERVIVAGEQSFVDGVAAALKPRMQCDECGQKSGWNRWAFTLYAQTAKLVGMGAQLEEMLRKALGVSLAETTSALSLYQSVSGQDVDAVAAQAEEFVRRYWRDRGKEVVIVDRRKQLTEGQNV